jgi:hypothetical protein
MLDPADNQDASPSTGPDPAPEPAERDCEVVSRRRPQGKAGKKRSGAPRPKVKKSAPAPPEPVYKCAHEGCRYTCRRKDLLDKHAATHLAKLFACNLCAWKFKSQGRLDKHIMHRHSDTSTYGQGKRAASRGENQPEEEEAPDEDGPEEEEEFVVPPIAAARLDLGAGAAEDEDGLEEEFVPIAARLDFDAGAPGPPNDELCRDYLPIAARLDREGGAELLGARPRGVKRKREQEAKSHVCSTCGRVCKTARDLKSHAKTHDSIENRVHFRCTWPGCPRTYLSEFARRQHVRAVHLKEKRFKCDKCSRAFAYKHNLATHKCSAEAAPEGPAKKQRRIPQPLGDASLMRFADKFFVSDELPMIQSLVREDVGCVPIPGDGRPDSQVEVDQHVD